MFGSHVYKMQAPCENCDYSVSWTWATQTFDWKDHFLPYAQVNKYMLHSLHVHQELKRLSANPKKWEAGFFET